MVEWIKNMDWGLFVAVLSLLFTGVVSFITIRYTKRSLDYTKESTRIAEESLQAAQKSIDTSIELYEKQKADELMMEENKNQNEINALKVLIYEEVRVNLDKLINTKKFCLGAWEMKLDNVNYNNLASEPFAEYSTKNGDKNWILFGPHSDSIINRYLLDASRLDDKLIRKLIALKYSINHFNNAFIRSLHKMIETNPSVDELSDFVLTSKFFILRYESECIDLMNYCSMKYNVN